MIKAENLEKIENFVETLDMPDWGYISGVELKGQVANIRYCDMATIYFDTEYDVQCGLKIDNDCAMGKWDLEFAIDVLDNKDKIISMLN